MKLHGVKVFIILSGINILFLNAVLCEKGELRQKRQQSAECTTWDGNRGVCDGIQKCPLLLFNLPALKNSLCLMNSFFPVPGVCCPQQQSVPITFPTSSTTKEPFLTATVTSKPLIRTTTPRTTRRTTTRRPTTKPPRTTKKPTTTKRTTTAKPTTKKPVTHHSDDDLDLICGQSNTVSTRIVGGLEAQVGAYPWVAAIFLKNRKGFGRTEFWCGGVVIDDQHVMTAAHCFHSKRGIKYKASQLTVVLGDHHLYRDTDDTEPEEFKVTKIKPHARFSRFGFYNDISLLKLDRKITFTESIQPVCLPRKGTIPEDFLGLHGTVTGWGTLYYGGPESGSLQEVNMPIWRNEDCNRVYTQQITDTFVCAGYADGGRDSCQGDSGSPMTIINKNGQWTVVGLVSFGNKCAQPGYPGVYTRISEYIDWIEAKRKT